MQKVPNMERVYRLPESTVPVQYTLKLDPYFENKDFLFTGEVEILINVIETTEEIILNAHDLDINESSVTVISTMSGLPVTILGAELDNKYETYTIKLQDSLMEGHKYEVSMLFKGYLKDSLVGFYKSSYMIGNETRWLAGTQFATTYARNAFPCFDEPALKASFKISIARASDYHTITNMPLVSSTIIQTDDGERILDTFEETPIMSTYLLAFIISDFASLSSGITSVWQRKEALSQATYCNIISQQIVSALEDYLEVKYSLPKLDQVAVPDLSAVAMENWGLITYRESYLLFDDELSSSADKQTIAGQVAHEIAHQWFGNLVSPKRWYFAWLNEGFAHFFQFHALTKVEPTWRAEDQYILHGVQKAMSLDSYYKSRPMTYQIENPSELPSIFDIIIYEKAGSVIRMISHSIGKETFRKGLSRYLKKFSYSSVDTSDLASTLKLQLEEELNDVDIEAVIESWSTQMGYPVITAKRDYKTGNVTVIQKRFTLSNVNNLSCDGDYKWWIPLTYTTKSSGDFSNTQAKLWMNAEKTEISKAAPKDDWIIFNIQQAGYYRVNYDVQNWQLILDHLNSDNFTDIHVLNRAQIIDDSFNLARAGLLDYSIALELAKYVSRETDYIPWHSALTAFSFVDFMMKKTSSYELFKAYTVPLVKSIYRNLETEGSSDSGHIRNLLKAEVFKWLCDSQEPGCVQNATENFYQFMYDSQKNRISPDIAPAIYCTAVAAGGEIEWNFLYKRFVDSNVETEKVTILKSLGCAVNSNTLERYLDLILSESSSIKTHMKSTALKSIYNNPVGTDIVLNYMIENYDTMSKYYAIGNSIDEDITGIAQMLVTQDQIEKMKNFLQDKEDTILASKKALSILEHNSEWMGRRAPQVAEWLRSSFTI